MLDKKKDNNDYLEDIYTLLVHELAIFKSITKYT